MHEVREIQLPGVGVRLEVTTDAGESLAVIVHRGGHLELAVYDHDDPDRCTTRLHLTADEGRTVAEMLGGSKVSEVATNVMQDIEGLAIDWLTVGDHSPVVNRSIGESMIRTRNGVSIVAVIRNARTIPSPEAEFVLSAGDVAVAVGTPAGINEVRTTLLG